MLFIEFLEKEKKVSLIQTYKILEADQNYHHIIWKLPSEGDTNYWNKASDWFYCFFFYLKSQVFKNE